jgi:hypothetical protein
MALDFDNESWRYVLAPVYVATYRYEDQPYQVMINGQTGTIAGQRPVDWTKVRLAVAALVGPGLLLSIVGLLTIILGVGAILLIPGVILLVIGVVIAFTIINKARRMDDV